MEMQMFGMKPKDAIELKKLRMDCIVTYYNRAKNAATSAIKPLIEYGLRRLTD